MKMQPASLDDVITRLETIVEQCAATNSRLGYFAALYLKVTQKVREGILGGQFQDGTRMEKLDVVFASRYLDAYQNYSEKQTTTSSWGIAFSQSEKSSRLVLQHLLLGMNAHINLDLGIAAVEVCGSADLSVIQPDFDAINNIILALTNEVLFNLGQVSPLLSLLGLHASDSNSALIQFSIGNARDGAWCFAESLVKKAGAGRDQFIAERDNTIAKLGKSLIQGTGFFMKLTLLLIHVFEKKNPATIIHILNDYKKQVIVVNNQG